MIDSTQTAQPKSLRELVPPDKLDIKIPGLPAPPVIVPVTESVHECGCKRRARQNGWNDGQTALGVLDLPAETTPTCYKDITVPASGALATLGFEFDMNYGASTVRPPLSIDDPGWGATVAPLEAENITTHRISSDGFRLEGDGNRIEIGTKAFEISAAGRKEMQATMKKILDLVKELKANCTAAAPDRGLGYPASVGAPRHFVPATLEPRAKCVVALAFNRKTSYFATGCALGASPQVTFGLPLARIDKLVAIIQSSESKEVAGRALSGPSGRRQGVRSVALYDARRAVNASRAAHVKARTTLSDGTVITESTFSTTLQGLLILMVSYLRTSELTYAAADYEQFAKAYLPLNVKNPFRLLYDDLTTTEKRVFKELYDTPRTNLWRLAKPGASASDGSNKLFPSKVHGHQGCWFDPIPTWNDFVEKTVTNTPLLRTEHCPGADKKGEDVGCEVLFAPLSRILPYQTGSRRVTVEMRRLGHNWVFSHGLEASGKKHPSWMEMTETLFDMALILNK